MKSSAIALKLVNLCRHFLKKHPCDELPIFEYTEDDVDKSKPSQVVYSIYKCLCTHSVPHHERLENAQEILDNPYAQKILKKTSFGERFLHIAKCLLTFNFKAITKTPAELMAHSIKKMFNNEKPRRTLEWEEQPKPQFKSMLPKGGLFEQKCAFEKMNLEQFADKYFRYESKR